MTPFTIVPAFLVSFLAGGVAGAVVGRRMEKRAVRSGAATAVRPATISETSPRRERRADGGLAGESAEAVADLATESVEIVGKNQMPCPCDTAGDLITGWYWSMPYVRKLLALVTEKTETAAMGIIEEYTEVQEVVSLAGDEARRARKTLDEAGEGAGVDALVAETRDRIAAERERTRELETLGETTRERTRESDRLIGRINSVVNEIADVADRSKVISINLGIEAAKIGKLGGPFKVIAQQLRQLNSAIAEASRSASGLMEDFSEFQTGLVEHWQSTILSSVASAGESTRITEDTIESLVRAIESIRTVFDQLIDRTIESETSMAEILKHLQFQDITRQQVENVDEIILDLVEQTRERREELAAESIHLDERDPERIRLLEEKLRKRFKVFEETSVLEEYKQ